MRRSASGSRVSDQFSQAKPSHSRSMSRSQSVRLVEDAELHLPRYDPSSQSGKREEKSRSRSAENVVHFIPLLLVLCVIILWLFSRSGKPFVLGLIGSMWLIFFSNFNLIRDTKVTKPVMYGLCQRLSFKESRLKKLKAVTCFLWERTNFLLPELAPRKCFFLFLSFFEFCFFFSTNQPSFI